MLVLVNMKITVLVAVLVIINGALAALPCNSRLRIIRPNLFKHCGNTCPYGQWSSWKITSKGIAENCTSKKAYVETRTRHSFLKSCPSTNETRTVCKYQYMYLAMHIASYHNILLCT